MCGQRSHIPALFRDQTWSSWFHINSRLVDRLQQRATCKLATGCPTCRCSC